MGSWKVDDPKITGLAENARLVIFEPASARKASTLPMAEMTLDRTALRPDERARH
jgi:hypothetical protein